MCNTFWFSVRLHFHLAIHLRDFGLISFDIGFEGTKSQFKTSHQSFHITYYVSKVQQKKSTQHFVFLAYNFKTVFRLSPLFFHTYNYLNRIGFWWSEPFNFSCTFETLSHGNFLMSLIFRMQRLQFINGFLF